MPEITPNSLYVLLALLCTAAVMVRLLYGFFWDRYAPIQREKAQVVDKYVSDSFSKLYGSAARRPQYYVVFQIKNKKQAFRVPEFSYSGYKLRERGTITYRGKKLIDFS